MKLKPHEMTDFLECGIGTAANFLDAGDPRILILRMLSERVDDYNHEEIAEVVRYLDIQCGAFDRSYKLPVVQEMMLLCGCEDFSDLEDD